MNEAKQESLARSEGENTVRDAQQTIIRDGQDFPAEKPSQSIHAVCAPGPEPDTNTHIPDNGLHGSFETSTVASGNSREDDATASTSLTSASLHHFGSEAVTGDSSSRPDSLASVAPQPTAVAAQDPQPSTMLTTGPAAHCAGSLDNPDSASDPLRGSAGAIPDRTPVTTLVAPPIQPDVEIDDEAYAESTGSSYLASIASEISRGILENERIYPSYGQYHYGMPVDEEEMDRMDLQHRKYEMLLGDKHFLAPIGDSPQRILDLGTGTGIWALDMADTFPSAQVIGVDIAPIQPKWVAPNCQFEIDDIEADWTWKSNSFDFIHLRDPLLMIRNWPRLMEQVYDHLKPGGWCELASIYPVPTSDDGSMPPTSGFKTFCDRLMEAAALFGTPIVPNRYADHMRNSGFIAISENIFKIPSSPWPKDQRMKKIAALEMTNVIAGATAFGLRAFERVFGWSKVQTEVAAIEFKRDVKNRNYHQYCPYYVVYGQKPRDFTKSDDV